MRVYIVCPYICIFWRHFCEAKANKDAPNFRIFTVFMTFFFSENLKNLASKSAKNGATSSDYHAHMMERREEKMDIEEKSYVNPTAQSKYIKQAKNASKANADKMASLNASRTSEMEVENGVETRERKERTTTPAKSARSRRTQKSASNYQTSSEAYDNDRDKNHEVRQGKSYVDVSNRQSQQTYNTTFPDFRSGSLVDGNKMDTAEKYDNRAEDSEEMEYANTPSDSKYLKRKNSSKTVPDTRQQQTRDKSPETHVATPRDIPANNTRTSTYTVNLEAPLHNNQEHVDSNQKHSESPPERKKVQ